MPSRAKIANSDRPTIELTPTPPRARSIQRGRRKSSPSGDRNHEGCQRKLDAREAQGRDPGQVVEILVEQIPDEG